MRFLALLAAFCAVIPLTDAVDPCKRQPFRGRCPSKNGDSPKRSQFVLRYYMRNGECVSYPYGHCSNDDSEPLLYRYKEECEDACINPPLANLGTVKEEDVQTYGTVGPIESTRENEKDDDKVLLPSIDSTTEVINTAFEATIGDHSTIFATSLTPTTNEIAQSTETISSSEVQSTINTSDAQSMSSEPTVISTEVTAETSTAPSTTTTSTTSTTTTSTSTSSISPSSPSTTSGISTANTEKTTTNDKIAADKFATVQPGITTKSTTKGSTTTPRTECERRRLQSSMSTIRGGFVPVCTPLGSFEKVQCEPDGRQCFCVDSKGIEVANSRTRNGQKPDCDKIQSASTPTTKECVGNADRGPCSETLNRWYYDEKEAECKRFVFSGCGGNGNNYETKEACTQRCAPPPMGLPKCEKGEPLKTKLGVAVNCAKSDCPSGYKCSIVQQTSVCCPENNKIIGLQTSATSDVCLMSKDRGPCDKYELRFYFNAELKECKYFFWGGCQGNGNNFEKVEDCESTCGISKVKGNMATTIQPSTPGNRPVFKTTQGIRITPGMRSKAEGRTTSEGSTSVVTSYNTAATIPFRSMSMMPSSFESTVDFNPLATGATQMVHVALTRAPPIPEMTLLEGIEDNSADGVNRCLHPKDPGNCRGQFVRWYWDNENKICDVFTYTGCQGNGNNYGSREECMAICHKEAAPVVVQEQNSSSVCKHDVDAGECNGIFQRFAFDTESGECRPFTYGGCGGNGNNFATLAECRIKCQKVALSPGNLCDHDIEVGECSGVFVRFGYDKNTNDCRQFTYGGCGGNGNNFATIQECRNVCIKKLCNPNPQCDLTRCQIVNDRNGCPFCSCPPTNQPSPPGLSTPQCPEIDTEKCEDPCMIINNRKGCKDCVCPASFNTEGHPPGSSDHDAVLPKLRSTLHSSSGEVTHLMQGVVRPPSMPAKVGPPSGPTIKRVQPPGSNERARQESVRTMQSTQTKQIEIDSKQLMPPPLTAQLQEKCMQPVEPGPCKHFVDRWYFNSIDGTCHPFKYGGCAGNRNHFFTQNECEIHCARFLRIASDTDDDVEEEEITNEERNNHKTPLSAGETKLHMDGSLQFNSNRTPAPPTRSTVPGHIVHADTVNYSVGREPVPLKPMGIGRHMMKLDIDGLEEPTTVIPLVLNKTRQAVTLTAKTTIRTTPTASTTSSPVSSTTTTASTTTTQQSSTTSRPTTTSVPTTSRTLPVESKAKSIDARIVCALPPDPGVCFDYVPRWFFNSQSGQCEQFSYGSCGGNENNFMERTACESKCMHAQQPLFSHISEQCAYASDGGFGGEYHVKWYFNVKNLRCEQFVYAGRGGNSNQFDTIAECERTCSPNPAAEFVKTMLVATQPPHTTVSPPHMLRPLPDEQPVHVSSQIVEDDRSQDYDNELYDTSTVTSSVTVLSNSIDSRVVLDPIIAPSSPVNSNAPGHEPHPPAAQAAKTVIQSDEARELPVISANSPETKKNIYKADPIPAKPDPTGNEGFPLVGPSPPMSVNYQTGEVRNRVNGIRTFQESSGRVTVEDSDLTEDEEVQRRNLLSCPNGLQEMRYSDGRPVMCLPGKNQCPEKSVCYFNGLDFFCCPNEEDPYDKHVFGGYDGEETKHGYKVFGPLNIRRLMDEVPLRTRRMANPRRSRREAASNTVLRSAPEAFNLDSIVAPLRFDDEKPRQVSRAQRMRSKPSPPNHGNPICVEPLSQGDCDSAHLRYYYDRETDTCRLFYYSGCKGNNNNFGSLNDCQKLCVLGGQRPRPQYQLTTSSSTSVPRGYCPDGTAPLGGSTPVLCGNSTDSIACPVGFYCLNGPPDVCCPYNKLEETADDKKSIRFAPKLADVPQAPSRKAHLSTPKYMCPDASDPIMSSNGEPAPCGSGFDGLKLCPRGFYCAIDVERQSRMCCPLYGAAERVPNDQSVANYLGRRTSKSENVDFRSHQDHDNAEETLDVKALERIADDDRIAIHSQQQGLEATTSIINEESGEIDDTEENESEEDGSMAHLMIKPADVPEINELTSSPIIESNDEGTIEMATEAPSVDDTKEVKDVNDKSVCQIKPSEGRTCREDEKAPRTNLHYFYSPKDRRCKLYFYRGCGGNANRFEKKSDCERLCMT